MKFKRFIDMTQLETEERANRAADICLVIIKEAYYDAMTSDGGSDHDHCRGEILLQIENLMELYGLTKDDMPALGNFFDKNGGL